MAKHVALTMNQLAVTVLGLFVLLSSCFYVHEGQQGIVLRLGEIVKSSQGSRIDQPGLHFKFPIIDHAQLFDTRLQTLEEKSSRILTQEQKYVLVDYYVKWRIADVPLYFKRTAGATFKTEQLISQKVNDALRAAFGERSITEVVSGERENVMQLLRSEANMGASSWGCPSLMCVSSGLIYPKRSVSLFLSV